MDIKGQILDRSFFERQTLTVARELLGCYLVRLNAPYKQNDFATGGAHTLPKNAVLGAGKICECEAYLGLDDKACHSYGGKRTRTAVMYGQGGFAYVYLIYGMHNCLNAVTQKPEMPEGVLIRALAPIFENDDVKKFSGPGKLTKALSITREHYASDLTAQNPTQVLILRPNNFVTPDIVSTKRVNINYSQEAADYPYRFYIKGCKSISKK